MDENGAPKVLYYRFKGTGGQLSDRDMIMDMKNHMHDGMFIQMINSEEREDCPLPPNTIRMDMWEASNWNVGPNGEGIVWTQFGNYNYKGYFPPFLRNLVLSNDRARAIKRMNDIMTEIKGKFERGEVTE